jgi:choline dehydrogenase
MLVSGRVNQKTMKFFLLFSLFRLISSTASQSYDYVVVGGGTAGLVVANRLTENGKYTVAIIEAGGYYEHEFPDAEIPGMDVVGAGTGVAVTTPIDWSFRTVPQAGANNRTLHYARGKCLGGR